MVVNLHGFRNKWSVSCLPVGLLASHSKDCVKQKHTDWPKARYSLQNVKVPYFFTWSQTEARIHVVGIKRVTGEATCTCL
jgi:hypothetical protein